MLNGKTFHLTFNVKYVEKKKLKHNTENGYRLHLNISLHLKPRHVIAFLRWKDDKH